jgi:hypothetical protein
LSTHLHLGLPSGLSPSGFPTNVLWAFIFSPHSCYMPCPSHLPPSCSRYKILATFQEIRMDCELMTEQVNIMMACSNSGLRQVGLMEVLLVSLMLPMKCQDNSLK